MTPESARDLLLRHGALIEGHYVLSSGLHSSRYLQCAVALQHPQSATALGAALAQRVREQRLSVQRVVSPALGGLIIGHEVARGLQVPACFTERVDGKMLLRRGFELTPGERVLLVEDVITTGLSSRETLATIIDLGATPVAAACIANRSGRDQLDSWPLLALMDLDVPSWDAGSCPLCRNGSQPTKPGSRRQPGTE